MAENRKRSATAVDANIAARIRERRIMLGLTQQQLAEMIGVTYQQAHKYERGINRVSAGQLFEIARVLNAPITYFYEGIATPQHPGTVSSEHARARLTISRALQQIEDGRKLSLIGEYVRLVAG